eukprot:8887953-Heterocapsa_arctica.AAC.1
MGTAHLANTAVYTEWMATGKLEDGRRNMAITELVLTMVTDPNEVVVGQGVTRQAKAKRDISAMVGVLAEGSDRRQGNKEMFKAIVDLGPGLFDTIGPRRADEY